MTFKKSIKCLLSGNYLLPLKTHVAFFIMALLYSCWDSNALLVQKAGVTVLCPFHMFVGESSCLLLENVTQDCGGT